LCHVTLKLAVSRSRPSVPYGANLLVYLAASSLHAVFLAYYYSPLLAVK